MSLREDALRAVVLKAIRDAIDADYTTARLATTEGLRVARTELGLRSVDVALPDGTKVATVSLVQPKPTVAVDQAGFLAWVQREHPAEVVPAVREAFRRVVMDRLVIVGGTVVDSRTGEQVGWAGVREAPEPSTFALRFTGTGGTGGRDGRDAIAAAWTAGELDGYAPGPKAVDR